MQVNPRGVAGTANAQYPVPVLVGVAGQAVPARVGNRVFRGDEPRLQTGHAHERLDGGAGRVYALYGAVEQGHVQGIAQGGIVLAADAIDEQVGVEPGRGHQGQHPAGARVDRHHGAAAVAQRLGGGALDADVEIQDQVGAGNRVVSLQHPQHPAVGIGFHILVAHFPVQDVLVILLHPHLANVESASIIGLIQLQDLALVDPADITQGVGKQLAMGVVAQQLGVHHHAGQAKAIHRQPRLFRLRQAKTQRHRLVGSPALELLGEIHDVAVADGKQLLQALQGRIQVGHLLADNGQHVTGTVVGQQHAVAIKDEAALGRQRLQLHPVAFGLGAVDLVFGNLQRVIAGQDDTQQGQHHHHRDHGARTVDPGFPMGVLEVNVSCHVKRVARLGTASLVAMIRVVDGDCPSPVQLFRQ